MRHVRWLAIDNNGRGGRKERELEIDVTWDEFRRICNAQNPLLLDRRGRVGIAAARGAVLALCERMFEPEVLAAIHQHAELRPRGLPLLRPVAGMSLDR